MVFLLCLLPAAYFTYEATYLRTELKEWVEVEAIFTDVRPEVVRAISAGNIEADEDGVITGRIAKVLSIQPAAGQSPNKDVKVLLELLCWKRMRSFCYGQTPVKMGGIVVFSTDSYTVNAEIVSHPKKKRS